MCNTEIQMNGGEVKENFQKLIKVLRDRKITFKLEKGVQDNLMFTLPIW